MKIVALGQTVIIKTIAPSAGSEIKSETGLILGIRDVGEVPNQGTVYALGPEVPPGIIKIGETVPLPHGKMSNVPHPDVAAGKAKASDFDEKYTVCHYTSISCVYRD